MPPLSFTGRAVASICSLLVINSLYIVPSRFEAIPNT